jgi:hypothetical protein
MVGVCREHHSQRQRWGWTCCFCREERDDRTGSKVVVQVVVEEGGQAVESETKTKTKHGKAARQKRLARLSSLRV